ncbi:acyloxyacyl hydrolase [Trichonephila clavipes]|nr:acyloxyacyl hydrolase [Trichonephila clavipes]
MEIPLRTAYGQNGRCDMQPKPSSLRAQAHQSKSRTETEKKQRLLRKNLELEREKGERESTRNLDEINVNGGKACAACTVLVGLLEQVTEVNNSTVTDTVSELCTYLPSEYAILCDILVHLWGPAIIEKLSNEETPDVVCYSLGICHVDEGMEYCHLFPEPEGGMESAVRMSRSGSRVLPFFHWSMVEDLSSACELPGVSFVCRTIHSILSKLKPFIDLDGDHYSIIETFRGDAWRGRDCDDVNDMIYPGRIKTNSSSPYLSRQPLVDQSLPLKSPLILQVFSFIVLKSDSTESVHLSIGLPDASD